MDEKMIKNKIQDLCILDEDVENDFLVAFWKNGKHEILDTNKWKEKNILVADDDFVGFCQCVNMESWVTMSDEVYYSVELGNSIFMSSDYEDLEHFKESVADSLFEMLLNDYEMAKMP